MVPYAANYHHSHSQQAPPIAYSAAQHNVKQPQNPSAPSANAFAFTARKESVQMVQGHISAPEHNTAGLGPATQGQFTMHVTRIETVVEEITVVGHAVREQPLAIEARVEEVECDVKVEEDSCFEKCIDCCCASYDCSCTIKIGNLFHQRQLISDKTLKEASHLGGKEVKNILFSLLGDALRRTWVILQLIFAIVNLGFSIAVFVAGNNEAFNIFHLALSIFSTVLVIIDSLMVFYNSCQKTNENKKHPFDMFRLIITEIILFPLLICNFFEVSITDGNVGTVASIIGLVLLAVDSIIFIVTVFLTRLYMIIAAIMRLKKHFKHIQDDQNSRKYKSIVITYASFFLIYVMFQMVTQVFMLVIISGRIRYDHLNRPGVNPTSGTEIPNGIDIFYRLNAMVNPTNETGIPSNDHMGVYVSPRLWYMIAVMSFLPLFGYLNYFVMTKYWTQEFPILMALVSSAVKSEKKIPERLLAKKVDNLHNVNVCKKLRLPFKSPVVAIICIVYTTFLVTFLVCGIYSFEESFFLQSFFQFEALSFEWGVFILGASIYTAIANIYVIVVAIVSLFIIITVVLFIILIIFTIIVTLLLFLCDMHDKICGKST